MFFNDGYFILGIITGLNINFKPSNYISTLSSNAVSVNSSTTMITVVTKSNIPATLPLFTQTLFSPVSTGITKTTVALSLQRLLSPVSTGITKVMHLPLYHCLPNNLKSSECRSNKN